MPRKRAFLERPHARLMAAAEQHAVAVADANGADETATETEPAEPSPHARSARRQKRSQGGTFTR